MPNVEKEANGSKAVAVREDDVGELVGIRLVVDKHTLRGKNNLHSPYLRHHQRPVISGQFVSELRREESNLADFGGI